MQINMTRWANDMIASTGKVPFPILSFPAVQKMGISVAQLVSDSTLQAQAMKLVADACRTSGSVSMMDLSVEAEAFGAPVTLSENEVPAVASAILTDPEDAERLTIPPVGAGRTGTYIEAIRMAAAQITDRPVFAGAIGPFSLAGRLMGMSEIMINCYDEPEMVETTLEKATEFLTAYIRAYKEAGANGVVIAEPAAGLLSAKMMQTFSGAYVRRIVEAVQDDSFLVIYHNCGNSVLNMMPELAAIGAKGYHFGNAVSMEKMTAGMPSDVLVMGNVDPTGEFRYGTPESVREATLRVLRACSARPNFILSSGCDIPPASDWNNIHAFFAAADEFYGRA